MNEGINEWMNEWMNEWWIARNWNSSSPRNAAFPPTLILMEEIRSPFRFENN